MLLLLFILLTNQSVGRQINPAPTTENVYIQNNTLVATSELPQIKVASLATLYNEPSNLYKESVQGVDLFCLIRCESGGNPEKINPNDMGTPSYGLLLYKLPTWNRYCVGDIMNGEDQIKCAQKMLQEPNGWRHWYNCAQKCL